MRAILILSLISILFCQQIPNANWVKHSIYENSLEIEEAFRQAYKEYSKNNSAEIDYLIRLTVYTQTESGTNYKVCFIDSKADYRIIQEYILFKPLAVNNRGLNEYQLKEHKQYDASNGIITSNDPKYSIVESEFNLKLKKYNEKLNHISYIYLVENNETNFYMITATTDNKEHQYIFCQDKQDKKFYIFNEVN